MAVVPIRKLDEPKATTKSVAANQKAIDALALNTGTWSVDGIPGLYVRCRATSKSFFLQRRVEGTLVNETIGQLPFKRAKEKAMKVWSTMKPRAADEPGLDAAVEAYIQHRRVMNKMADSTEKLARYNTERYLEVWKARTLEQIGKDRAGLAAMHSRLTQKHGAATCNQVMRLLSAVYRWHKDRVQIDLPEWPRKIAEIHDIAARDWAYSDEELRAWWRDTKTKDGRALTGKAGEPVYQGVSTLGTIKRMWWLTALFTGARKGSLEALKWPDLDLERKIVHFRVAKGDRPYVAPLSDRLVELLKAYRDSNDLPPSHWVFPSVAIDGAHLKDVKNSKEGVGPAHRLRHTFRTTLAQLGATPDQARLLMGHSMGGDVSRGYITAPLVVESLRPITNAVAARYVTLLEAGQVRLG